MLPLFRGADKGSPGIHPHLFDRSTPVTESHQDSIAADEPLAAKARAFRALHAGPGAFVIPNPWDAGSARILEALGFSALATTSGGLAFASGRRDGMGLMTREETLANAATIAAATSLPVSADLENGFGDSPEDAAETIRRAARVGIVGGSIEDATGDPTKPIYERSLAVERIAAAVEVVRALPFPFTLTARAENFLHGREDLEDTIERLQAFERAGADVVFAPGLPDLNAIHTVCRSVSCPVNVLAGVRGGSVSLRELADAGVKRISLGSALYRAAIGGFLSAANEVASTGTFDFARNAPSYAQISEFMKFRAIET
jgi:2-methylisocitrate lyase-like PEP mutase family enzyme